MNNRDVLIAVAEQIEPLLDEVVFVGGQVAPLLVTDPAATRVRPTIDVDIVIETSTRVQYRELEERLLELGLSHDTAEGAPICRWVTPEGGHPLDVMPTIGEVLGFSNEWYNLALELAEPFELRPGLRIQIPPAPVYVATKWDAFTDRGGADYLASHDLEDLIAVVAGRDELVGEMERMPDSVRVYVAAFASEFLAHSDMAYAVQGALPDSAEIPELIDLYDVDPTEVTQLRHFLDKIRERKDVLTHQQKDIAETLDEIARIEAQCSSLLSEKQKGRKTVN